MLEGNVLITGGSGFLGRAILRRAKKENWPASFTVYSRDETKQWELKRRYPDVRCVLGDVSNNLDRLTSVMQGHDIVIHAAAVKYIPEAEFNVFETIDVNIEGSRNVTIAARVSGVKKVVGISTDKACGPLNVYGMTKGIMERMFSEANRMGHTSFVTVRYGNVVGSTGSVIPVFKQQIEDNGQLKVTDNRMTRFWLSVDEAIDLILWSLEPSTSDINGYTFIPRCPAMKIVDIAKAVWKMERELKDYWVDKETTTITPRYTLPKEPDIVFTGIRPGEKLHEHLFNQQEAPRVYEHTNGFLLAPATDKNQKMPNVFEYTSEQPKRWLSIDEMIELIEDAKSV